MSNIEKISKKPVEEINSHDIRRMDSLDILKETLKRIEVEIDSETTDGDKYGKTLQYHQAHFKKCLESEKFVTAFKQLPMEEQIAWTIKLYEKICKDLPKSIVSLIPGAIYFGTAPRSLTEIPKWLDMEKFRKGQQFAKENCSMIWLSLLYGINLIYFFEDGLRPMLMTGKSNTPYAGFKRYLSTIRRMDEIFFGDPWTEGSPAQQQISYIRMQHLSIGEKLKKYDNKTLCEGSTLKNPYAPSYELLRQDLQETCPIPAEGQCPFNMWNSASPKKIKPMSQVDMAMVQLSYVAFIVMKPEIVGIHNATDEDIEAFCHMWKGIGYLLGIENEFNICNGTLEEIRQLVKDLIEYWIKPNLRDYHKDGEHALRVIYEGTSYYYPFVTYEIALLQVSEAIGLNMTNLRNSLSYSTWIYYNMYKFFTCRMTSQAWFRKLINKSFTYAKSQALSFSAKKHENLREKSSKSMLNTSIVQPLPME